MFNIAMYFNERFRIFYNIFCYNQNILIFVKLGNVFFIKSDSKVLWGSGPV